MEMKKAQYHLRLDQKILKKLEKLRLQQEKELGIVIPMAQFICMILVNRLKRA
jgi:hypothetical protein